MRILLLILPLLLFVFWLWMLIDCLTKETSGGNNKLIWLLLLIFLPGIGALLYFFIRRQPRINGGVN